MSAVVRGSTDVCSGHGCWPPRMAAQGSPNVFCNGFPVHRVSDLWEDHTCVTTHNGRLAAGSPNVFCNGLPVGRIGDPIDCGSTAATGSPNVFCNGS